MPQGLFLGIEIGGTKLQLGVGRGDGTPIVELQRAEVDQRRAADIRRQIEAVARPMIEKYAPRAVGFGFGGPVDAQAGRTVKSHQVEGWDDFPLAQWCRQTLGLPARLSNDADAAGVAEARFGAGRKDRVVFYITVGSGIGGALMIGGQLYGGGRGIASEIGHLRPGLDAEEPERTVESAASGFGLAAKARAILNQRPTDPRAAALLRRCGAEPEHLSGRMVVEAAGEGDPLACEIFQRGLRTLGWAIAQVVTLVAPEVVVLGGGVPLAGESLFFEPLRREVARYVFPPLTGSYRLVGAELGEEVVVHGALAIAAELEPAP
ncbi:MAG: ROK family protein [Thermoguttaceae bacterium]|jgi:glucokinase